MNFLKISVVDCKVYEGLIMVRPVYWHYAKNSIDSVAKDYSYVLNLVKPVEKKPVYTTVTDTIKPLEKKVDYKAIVNKESIDNNSTILSIFESTNKPKQLDILKEQNSIGKFIKASDLALNVPNIIDDATEAIKNFDKITKAQLCNDKRYLYLYKKAYDYNAAQHPFSYFRGTLLKDVLNPKSPMCKFPKLAKFINKVDVSLWDTKLGEINEKFLKIIKEDIKTKIKSIETTPQKPINIKAYKFISKGNLGKITARAMTRTPVIGLAVAGAIETSQIIDEIKQGEKAIKSIGKGLARLSITTVVTGVCGAIGSVIGPAGSLLGICAGTFLSNGLIYLFGF